MIVNDINTHAYIVVDQVFDYSSLIITDGWGVGVVGKGG